MHRCRSQIDGGKCTHVVQNKQTISVIVGIRKNGITIDEVLKLIIISSKKVPTHTLSFNSSAYYRHTQYTYIRHRHTDTQRDTVINTHWYTHTLIYTDIYLHKHIHTDFMDINRHTQIQIETHTQIQKHTEIQTHKFPYPPPVSLLAQTREFKDNECVNEGHEP